MKSKKFCYIIIIVLVVLNVFSWRLWWEKPPFPRDKGPKFEERKKGGPIGFLTEKLQLDTVQQAEITMLMNSYFEHVGEVNHKIADYRSDLADMVTENKEEGIDTVIINLSKLKTDLEYATFQHFKSVREVCREDQQAAFDSIMYGMMRRFDGEHRRHKPDEDKKENERKQNDQ